MLADAIISQSVQSVQRHLLRFHCFLCMYIANASITFLEISQTYVSSLRDHVPNVDILNRCNASSVESSCKAKDSGVARSYFQDA